MGTNCIEKTLCKKVENPSNSESCNNAYNPDETKYKCIFEPKDQGVDESTDKCILKEICCEVSLTNSENCAIILDQKKKYANMNKEIVE